VTYKSHMMQKTQVRPNVSWRAFCGICTGSTRA
jgi:hypothetical protein